MNKEKHWKCVHLEEVEREDLEIHGCWTGMREKGIKNMEWIKQRRRMQKRNKTLGTERCENIDNLHMSEIIGRAEACEL